MNPAEHNILAISGGSSSIKFAIFAAGSSFYMESKGQIKRIGTLYCLFSVQGNDLSERFINPIVAQDHMFAIKVSTATGFTGFTSSATKKRARSLPRST